ncbi:MAG TPA: hypothetical protein VGM56_13975 [Byssovorax sp.]
MATVAVVPASTLTDGSSILLAPSGCLGGPGKDTTSATLACGAGFSSTHPTATLVALALSRITEIDAAAIQVVHASLGSPELYVDGKESALANTLNLANSLRFGAAQPTPPFYGFQGSRVAPGGSLTTWDARVGTELLTTTFDQILPNGDLGGAAMANGRAYALVAIGASASLPTAGFWKPFGYAAIRSDP